MIKDNSIHPLFQPYFKLPLSGDVNQKIDPHYFFGNITAEVGNAEIEKEVFTRVASYGKQLNALMNLVLEMAEKGDIDNDNEAFKKLKTMKEKIDEVKENASTHHKENAKTMLDKLQRTDEKSFEALIKEYYKKLPEN